MAKSCCWDGSSFFLIRVTKCHRVFEAGYTLWVIFQDDAPALGQTVVCRFSRWVLLLIFLGVTLLHGGFPEVAWWISWRVTLWHGNFPDVSPSVKEVFLIGHPKAWWFSWLVSQRHDSFPDEVTLRHGDFPEGLHCNMEIGDFLLGHPAATRFPWWVTLWLVDFP